MKVAFRQQASEYDCVPTTFINALSYLFDRGEIPPFVVHRIYKDCLDIDYSLGTSRRAIKDLGFWLSNYKEESYDKFAVESKFIRGSQVHLKENSIIIRCINAQGTALMRVHLSHNDWHYILGFRLDGEWLYCFDPLPRSKRFINNGAVQFIENTGPQDANLRIRCEWLDKVVSKTEKSDEDKYVLGRNDHRECLLLNRIHP